jgi:phospholipid-binding lipoprotein MlaA
MSRTAVALAMMIGAATLGVSANAADIPDAETPKQAVSPQSSPASDLPDPAPTFVDIAASAAPAQSSVPAAAAPDSAAPLPLPLPTEATAPAPPLVSDAAEISAASPEDEQSEIVVGGSFVSTPGDPLERLNAQSFEAVQSVDGAIVAPVAKAYNKGLPRPIRQGLRNFFSNLDEPIIFGAYLLQLKPRSAIKTAGRFVINSTLGIAGVMDVAKRKPFNLPYKPNGIADTLGYYGVGPGPYFYLPVIGPTTLRDLLGNTVEIAFQPLAIGGPFAEPAVSTSTTVLDQIGERAAFDDRINKIRKEDDPYATYRDQYLKQRQAEIDALHGRETAEVVPVYGPGLRTAGGKADKPQVDTPAEAQAHDSDTVEPALERSTSGQEAAEAAPSVQGL